MKENKPFISDDQADKLMEDLGRDVDSSGSQSEFKTTDYYDSQAVFVSGEDSSKSSSTDDTCPADSGTAGQESSESGTKSGPGTHGRSS